MPDFIGAFKQGLEAAEAAEAARYEINDVFVELDKQMREGSDGRLGVHRKEKHVSAQGMAAFAALPYLLTAKKRDTYWAIVATNPLVPESPAKELATWSEDRAGYPCKIAWANMDRTCADKESLEISLVELLRDPAVGEKLTALMKLEPSPKDEVIEEAAQQGGCT